MKQIVLCLILSLIIILSHCQKNKSISVNDNSAQISQDIQSKPTDSTEITKAQENDKYLDDLNKGLFEDDKPTNSENNDENKAKENEDPEDGNWAIMINDVKVSKSEFEREYNKFRRLAKRKTSKKEFINNYIYSYLVNRNANGYFASKSKRALLNFVKQQAVVKHYISKKFSNKYVKTPSQNVLSQFYNQLIQEQPQFKKLSLKKDRHKIIQMYKNFRLNQKYAQLQNSLLGKHKVIKNDEWENGIIEKYVANKINRRLATGSKYKNYWLYKIVSGKKVTKKIYKKQNVKISKKKKSKKIAKKTNKPKINNEIKISKKNKIKPLESLKESKVSKKEKTIAKKDNTNIKEKIENNESIDDSKEVEPIILAKKDEENTSSKNTQENSKPVEKFKDITVNKLVEIAEEKKELKTKSTNEESKTEEKEKVQIEQESIVEKETNDEQTIEQKNQKNNEDIGLFEHKEDLSPNKVLSTTSKTKYKNEKIYYIKDVENKLYLLNKISLNKNVLSIFRSNSIFRQQFINQFLFEELVYLRLKESRLLYSSTYKRIAYNAEQGFKMNYYLKNVLRIRNQTQQRNFVLNFINNNTIKQNEAYFDSEK